jgi:uncharacterized protein YndB with AHSA1/START domain
MRVERGLDIRCKTYVHAAPARVWKAVATAEGLDGWFTAGSRVLAEPDGHIHFRWRDWGPDRVNSEAFCPVVEAQPPSRLVFRWTPLAGAPDHRTTVELDLERRGEGTVVHLSERSYPLTEAGLRAYRSGAVAWGEALTLLKFWVEHGLRYSAPPVVRPRRKASHR